MTALKPLANQVLALRPAKEFFLYLRTKIEKRTEPQNSCRFSVWRKSCKKETKKKVNLLDSFQWRPASPILRWPFSRHQSIEAPSNNCEGFIQSSTRSGFQKSFVHLIRWTKANHLENICVCEKSLEFVMNLWSHNALGMSSLLSRHSPDQVASLLAVSFSQTPSPAQNQ